MTPEIDPENADLFDGRENGSLHIYLARNPETWHEDKFDMRLDFHADDWFALFVTALGVPLSEFDGRPREWREARIRQVIPEYPALALISDTYVELLFMPDHVLQLRSECSQVKLRSTPPGAVRALRKLIYACDEATKRGFSLLLIGD